MSDDTEVMAESAGQIPDQTPGQDSLEESLDDSSQQRISSDSDLSETNFDGGELAQDTNNESDLSQSKKPVRPWRLPFWTEDPIHRSTVLDADPDSELRQPIKQQVDSTHADNYNQPIDDVQPGLALDGEMPAQMADPEQAQGIHSQEDCQQRNHQQKNHQPRNQSTATGRQARPQKSPSVRELAELKRRDTLYSTRIGDEDDELVLADDSVQLHYPTVEELEKIRRDAYTDGLEQGLIEGRQKGQKEGHDAGFKQGFQEGQTQGLKQGQEQGFHEGREKGYQTGEQATQGECQHLQHLVQQLLGSIQERDSQLPTVLTNLLVMMSEQVLQHELQVGAQSIYKFIEQSLDFLPSGEACCQIDISQDDYQLLQTTIQQQGSVEWLDTLKVDAQLNAGHCRVTSEHSLVEYSLSDAMQQQLLQIAEQCLFKSQDFPHQQEMEETDLTSPTADQGHNDPVVTQDNVEASVNNEAAAANPDTTPATHSDTAPATNPDTTPDTHSDTHSDTNLDRAPEPMAETPVNDSNQATNPSSPAPQDSVSQKISPEPAESVPLTPDTGTPKDLPHESE